MLDQAHFSPGIKSVLSCVGFIFYKNQQLEKSFTIGCRVWQGWRGRRGGRALWNSKSSRGSSRGRVKVGGGNFNKTGRSAQEQFLDEEIQDLAHSREQQELVQ